MRPPFFRGQVMKIKITSDRNPWVNGTKCAKGQELDVSDADAKILIDNGMAEMADEPKRARNEKGQLIADNPDTPENEAWEGGKAPKKKNTKK